MTKFLRYIALAPALLASCFASPALAQERPDADPAMWVVADEDTTVYLFGTFHMLDGKIDWFNDAVLDAYDASDEVVFEAVPAENPAELQPLIMKYAIDISGTPISEKLSEETMAKLVDVLGQMGAPATAFDQLDPWFVGMQLVALEAQKLGLTGEHGPEAVISKAAREDGKKLGELEGYEYQFRMFDEMPLEIQSRTLEASLKDMAEMGEQLGTMQSYWANAEVDELTSMLKETSEDIPEFYEALFPVRNALWANWIEGRLAEPGTVFIAVGLGHLAGDDSVQAFLADKGIESQRVEY